MSREFYNAVGATCDDIAVNFSRNNDGIKRRVECRVEDKIYVYLYEGDSRVQTQHVDIPDSWQEKWPSDITVRRHIRRLADIGNVRISHIER